MHVPPPHGLVLVVLCMALISVALFDWRRRKIPNEIVLGIAIGALAHAIAFGGVRAALASVLGACSGVAFLSWQFRRGLMGAGDVKLLGALGGWTGAIGALYILVLGSAFGGLLAVISLLRLTRRERREIRENLATFAQAGELSLPSPADLPRSRGIPYGVAFAVAGAGVLLLGVAR